MITAEDIAKELNVNGRKLRGFLRDEEFRPASQKNQRWYFSRDQADEVKRRFRVRFG